MPPGLKTRGHFYFCDVISFDESPSIISSVFFGVLYNVFRHSVL